MKERGKNIMGGIADIIKFFARDITGNFGDGLGIASAFTDDNSESGKLGIASGSLGLFSNLSSIVGGAMDSEKESSDWDMLKGFTGAIGSIGDIVDGAGTKKGDSTMEKVGKGISFLGNIAGGIVGIARGINGFSSDDKDEKSNKWLNLGGGVAKIFSGITSAGRIAHSEAGDPKAAGWKTAGKISAASGGLMGLLSSVASGKDAFSKDTPPDAQVR